MAAAAQASASPPRSTSVDAAPPAAFGALQDLRPEGRNLLIVYAVERALPDLSAASRENARIELGRFANALLQQQPPMELGVFLDHLRSEDPSHRSAAEARKLAYDDALRDARTLHSLNTGIEALTKPGAQRMLTLAQALQRGIKGRTLETLLPEADQPLLQWVRDFEDKADRQNAQTKLTALCRFGVALMDRGHGGLAAWLQMRHQQPDGERLAEDLRKSIEDGLTHGAKRWFVAATGRLMEYGLSDGSASTSRPQARTDAPTARTPPPSATGPAASRAAPAARFDAPRRVSAKGRQAAQTVSRQPAAPSQATRTPPNDRPPQAAAPRRREPLASGPSTALDEPVVRPTVSSPALAAATSAAAASLHDAAAAPANTVDELRHVPPEGRSVLVAYALEPALTGMAKISQQKARKHFSDFGHALLQGQPPITLDAFLDQVRSNDPAQSSAAKARMLAFEANEGAGAKRAKLESYVEALSKVPREQRMLTLQQALNRDIPWESMQMLLPEADRPILQRVRDSRSNPDNEEAQRNQTSLIRFGVALMARGHGGLADWLQMRNQPDGERLAEDLRKSIVNGPELNLGDASKRSKRRFDAATARLVKYGPGDGSASTSGPQATTSSPQASADAPAARTPPPSATGPSAGAPSTPRTPQSPEADLDRLAETGSFLALLQEADEARSARSPAASGAALDEPVVQPSVSSLTLAAGGSAAAASPSVAAASANPIAEPSDAPRPPAFDALQDLRPEGRNTLIVYAAERALSDRAPAAQQKARAELSRFGDELLQQQPAITLETLLDHLQSGNPAQRSAAERHKLAYENSQRDATEARYHLNVAINALADLPREQRMLTLAEVLQREGRKGGDLETLLPEADRPLLRRVRDSEREPDSDNAQRKLTALCRFGVALMVRGHGGLAAWMEMRQQPDGERLAEDLRKSIVDGPELKLTHRTKRTFAAATGRLMKYGLGDGGASASGPQARTDAPTTRTPPREATGPADPMTDAMAVEPAMSWSIGSAFDRFEAGGLEALLPGAADEVTSAHGAVAAQETAEEAASPPQADAPTALAADVTMDEAAELAMEEVGGPSAAVASPTDSSWSLGAEMERLGGTEGLSALLQEMDEVAPARSPVRTPSPEPAAFGAALDAAVGAADTVQLPPGISPAGRNMLVVYAVERNLPAASHDHARTELRRFADALLQQQPPIELDAFLDQLQSEDPAQRSAAEARKLAYESTQHNVRSRSWLNTGIEALKDIPRAQRMLTLVEALQRDIKGPHLETLLPEADLSVLQRVKDAERRPDSEAAKNNPIALIRFGVALMARGHGGLSAWLQMRNQPDGVLQAAELRDSIKDGPELNLDREGKRRFVVATGRLVAHGAGDGGTTSARPQAAAGPSAATPQTGPSAAAASPAGSSEFLGAQVDAMAVEPAMSWSVGSAFDRFEAGGVEALLPGVADEVTSTHRTVVAAGGVAQHPGDDAVAAQQAPVDAASQQHADVPTSSVADVTMEEVAAAPSAAPASPTDSSWSLGAALDALGGADGLDALFQQMDEVASARSPVATNSSAGADAADRRDMAQAVTHQATAAQSRASAASRPVAAQARANDQLRDISPQGLNELVVHAAEWALDPALAASTQKSYRNEFRRFGEALLRGQPPVTLTTFLDCILSHDPAERATAKVLKAAYERAQKSPGSARKHLDACINALNSKPHAQRIFTLPQALQRKVKAKVLQMLMLPADLDLLKQLAQTRRGRGSRHQVQLSRLSVALRAGGYAGLVGWLQMRKQPEGIARADELIKRFKNSPVMDLNAIEKSDLDEAIERLVEQGLADGGAATADPRAAVPVPATVDVTMEEAAGPSAAAASPADSTWSLGAEIERLSGTEGLSALLQQVDEVADPSSFGAAPLHGSPGAHPAAPLVVTDPALPAFDLGDVAGPSWIHRQQPATPALMVALGNLGWLPSAQAPQTTLQIHGRTYAAHVHDGTVWLTPSRPAHEITGSSQLAPLPTGRVSLAALDADLGIASGRGLNCLLDTVLQLARGTRRQDHATTQLALAQDAQDLRRALAAVGLVERQGQIDVYGPGGVGVFLAQNLGLRIQIIEANEHDGLLAHPVIGQEGPLVRILHTPGHFQPLWPRQGQ